MLEHVFTFTAEKLNKKIEQWGKERKEESLMTF